MQFHPTGIYGAGCLITEGRHVLCVFVIYFGCSSIGLLHVQECYLGSDIYYTVKLKENLF